MGRTDGSLALKNVVKRFGGTQVIYDVSFDVADGEFVVFVGPSGCGKSTLLRMICGLESVSDGEICIGGDRVNEVSAARRGLALVFQSYALYPHMTVYQNMAFGLENLGMPRAEIEKRVAEAARMLRLGDYLQRKPTALSGGQRQRVAIGRAIVREPRIFLFDEPLSNLDAELRVGMRAELADLHRRLGTTMIYVTHDQVEAMTMADKIVVLRAGRVEQVGAPLELYNHPQNRFVAGFIGSPQMNFLEGRVAGANGPRLAVELPGLGTVETRVGSNHAAPGTAVAIGIRPEHVQAGHHDGNNLIGKVSGVEQLGGLSYVRLGNPDITVQIPGQTRLAHGEATPVHFPADAIHVFDADGLTLSARA
ncbi:ABC transporter ATP-binding protein [Aliidongia dinghuensis]|uniref:ABC transporter ATP-binding protein n=2 Tax=Aliidongia dinghuensis TaxID=1867774 RepID=A0A8J2YX71_9PROT|nr:ABC transporter ATP-binding protein [Aliidongia dinghuensis]